MKDKVYHFIGIGGIGMSAIALVMRKMGYHVQGSDKSNSPILDNLAKHDIKIFCEHNASYVSNVDTIVVSSAIKESNVEFCEAKSKNIKIISRGSMLSEIMSGKKGLAVSGTHGKTTTTALLAHAMDTAGLDPTVINGGIINSMHSNAKLGSGEFFVSEADESDGSFNLLPKHVGIVTNIDYDHMDYHKTFDSLIESFVTFIESVNEQGFVVLCGDDKNLSEIAKKTKKKVILYGTSSGLDVQAFNLRMGQNNKTLFDCKYRNTIINDIELNLIGDHNVKNATAVLVTLLELGVDIEFIRIAFSSFQGVQRRFTNVGEFNGVKIIDDYAHHPSEIRAVIGAAKKIVGNGKIISVIQPHRYSRFFNLFDEFCSVIKESDYTIMLPIYASGENPIEGLSSENFVLKMNNNGNYNVMMVHTINELSEKLMKIICAGDMILMLGAGDITNWARCLKECLTNTQSCFIENTR